MTSVKKLAYFFKDLLQSDLKNKIKISRKLTIIVRTLINQKVSMTFGLHLFKFVNNVFSLPIFTQKMYLSKKLGHRRNSKFRKCLIKSDATKQENRTSTSIGLRSVTAISRAARIPL